MPVLFGSRGAGKTLCRREEFPEGRVKLIFKQFPLDFHAQAGFAAEAALAAQGQGKFWEMHDRLYGGFHLISRAGRVPLKYAKDIGARYEPLRLRRG